MLTDTLSGTSSDTLSKASDLGLLTPNLCIRDPQLKHTDPQLMHTLPPTCAYANFQKKCP